MPEGEPCACLVQMGHPTNGGCEDRCTAEGCEWPCKTCGMTKLESVIGSPLAEPPHPLYDRCAAHQAFLIIDAEFTADGTW